MLRLLRTWTSNRFAFLAARYYSRSTSPAGLFYKNKVAMSTQNNFINKIFQTPRLVTGYIKESYAELRKVSWPSRQTTIQYTIIVAAASIVVGLVVGGIDFLLTLTFEQLIT